VTFGLYDSPTSNLGQLGISQTINPVTVTNGLFTVLLNVNNQFGSGAFDGHERYLQTTVQCPGDSSPLTLSRQRLSAVPYALFAAAPWVTTGGNISYNLGRVVIGV
jgi:hypothetical protein